MTIWHSNCTQSSIAENENLVHPKIYTWTLTPLFVTFFKFVIAKKGN